MSEKEFATTSERVTVPHDPLYIDYFERDRFVEDLVYQFDTLIDTHRAWLVMLVAQDIVSREDARPVLSALNELKQAGPDTLTYRSGHQDLYTHMEQWLIAKAGAEKAAHLSLARTRPEPLLRMYFREQILDCLEALYDFRATLLDSALEHKDSVMPGYTHQQHGQPTTLGAYVLGIHDPLERSSRWLEMAYETTNESTMGCGALSGTSLPIDRYQVSDLLGFDTIMESTLASVSTGDHLTQAVSAANDVMITLSRLCMDFEQWSNTEHHFMEPAPQFSDVSSMMPQKKNPCVFEVVRGRVSRVFGDTVGVYAGLLKAFYADVLDMQLTYGPSMKIIEQTRATMVFLREVIRTLIVHKERMLEATARGFSTVSEIADQIYRTLGLPHRLAHTVVAKMVTRALEEGLTATEIDAAYLEDIAQEVLDRKLGLSDELVRNALDPVGFVNSHDLPGGPAPKETVRMVEQRRIRIAEERDRLNRRRQKLTEASATLDQVVEALL